MAYFTKGFSSKNPYALNKTEIKPIESLKIPGGDVTWPLKCRHRWTIIFEVKSKIKYIKTNHNQRMRLFV